MKELERPSVDGVFLDIVIQTYATLNDLLLHHKLTQFTPFCLLRQFFNVRVTLGDLKSAFMQSDEDDLRSTSRSLMERGLRKVP